MINPRTVAPVIVCSVSLLTGFLIFPETASGQYRYEASLQTMIDAYKDYDEQSRDYIPGKRGTILSLTYKTEWANRIIQFLYEFDKKAYQDRRYCKEADHYHDMAAKKPVELGLYSWSSLKIHCSGYL
jgi:hypothetical protein